MRGRPPTKRQHVLYTRVVKSNLSFLNRVCKKTKLSKSEFIDNVLTAMRAENEKIGNKIQRENQTTT